jgi:hypothetical protein
VAVTQNRQVEGVAVESYQLWLQLRDLVEFWAGVASTLVMGLGTAITVAAIAMRRCACTPAE